MKLIGCEYTCNCSVSQVLFAFYFERKVRPDFSEVGRADQLRIATRSAENGDTEVLRLDSDRSTRTYSCGVFEQCGPVRFHKDGERVYFLTNKGSDVDLVRLESFNPATGKEELVGWIVNETARTPQGEIIDVSTIEKGSLLLKRRFIKQGPMTIETDVTPNKVSGSTTMSGQSTPIDADPGGALFANGARTFEVIAALPLAAGYALSFRNFDVQKQKAQIKQLKVVCTACYRACQELLMPIRYR